MNKQKLFLLIFICLFLLITLGSSALAITPETNDRTSHSAAANPLDNIHINEVLFQPDTGNYEWIELKNGSTNSISIDGYNLTDEDGNFFSIPGALPNVPVGAFVLVIFDGLGSSSNDYDFSDNTAILHSGSGLVDVFDDDADQVALYSRGALNYSTFLPVAGKEFLGWNPPISGPPAEFPASALIDYLAWGDEPGEDANEANTANIWNPDWYVSLYRGLGEEFDETRLVRDESIGLVPGSTSSYPEDWVLFQAGEVTGGAENAFPGISWHYPTDGATLDSETFSLIWADVPGATGYDFQLDNNSDFSSPEVATTLSAPNYTPANPVAEGLHHWRVKVRFGGNESPWSPGREVNSLILPAPFASHAADTTVLAFRVLGIPWQLQHKDTNMACLDGDAESGNQSWIAPHNARGTHGRNYCVRASVAMLASYYGGNLSQDRITYETFKGGGAEGDLGHDVPFSGSQARASLSWALGANVPANFGKPTFDQIKAWIDADRPMRAVVPGHSRAIDGYFDFTIGTTTHQFLHVLDPWDRAKWVSYASDNIIYVQVGPAGVGGAPNVRSDEDVDGDNVADTMDDLDGDGVSDFDERNRFSTSYNDVDTDSDLVQDLPDIREYVFNAAGAYSLRNADLDGDGARKELDPDSDYGSNEGTTDGCEDSDHDGRYEASLGETNNFSPVDDKILQIQLTWPQIGSDVDLHLIKPGAAMWSSGDNYYGNLNPDWGPAGPCGNPILDIDCITGCTVENIRLDKLEPGIYNVKVHYFSDHDLGPATPRVVIWVQGTRYVFGPQQLTDDQIWDVATVEMPTNVVTPGNSILISQNEISEESSPLK